MAKARSIPDLSADEPMAAAAAKILAIRSQELADHSRGVLDVTDIERLHDMRVATRRLRAALEVFEASYPRKAHKAALKEVKEIADALGERRDRDVAIASLERFQKKLAAPDRRGVESLLENLRLEQAEANEALRTFVTNERVAELRQRLGELIADALVGLDTEETSTEGPPDALARSLASASAENGNGALR